MKQMLQFVRQKEPTLLDVKNNVSDFNSLTRQANDEIEALREDNKRFQGLVSKQNLHRYIINDDVMAAESTPSIANH